MKFRDLLPNDQKPKLQLLAKLTSPYSYNKGCLWPNCSGKAIKAHVVARNWMKAIEVGGETVEIYPRDWNYLSREVILVDTPRGRRPIQLDPKRRDIPDTQCYPFLCHHHDVDFKNVDNLTETQDYSLRNLNWTVYRSVLAQEWRVESRKWALTQSGIFGPSTGYGSNTAELRASVYSKLNESLDGLGYYKRKLAQCLEPQNCGQCDGTHCSFVAHQTLHLRGEPKLAACTFSLGIRGRENWGLTVVPLSDGTGHDVIWHHFGEHSKITEKRISLQRKAQGRKREELVSQCILRLADALVVSPEWWDSIGDKRRDAILEMVSGETGIATGTPEQVSWWVNRANTPILDLPNPRQLNLFRDV